MDWFKEKDKLYKLIYEEKVSYEKIGKMYGVSGAAIRKAASGLFGELPKRRVINPNETFNKGEHLIPMKKIICKNCLKEFYILPSENRTFCSSKCDGEYKHKQAYKAFCEGNPKYMRGNYSPKNFKDYIMEEQNNVCAICGMPPLWNGKKLVFIADHIDGNAANNVRSNIRCICPNCDSQLSTYKSKNKNGARSYYRYHRYEKDKNNK